MSPEQIWLGEQDGAVGAGEGVLLGGQVVPFMPGHVNSDDEAGATNVALEWPLGADLVLVTASNVRLEVRL